VFSQARKKQMQKWYGKAAEFSRRVAFLKSHKYRNRAGASGGAPLEEELRVAIVNYTSLSIQSAREKYAGRNVRLVSMEEGICEAAIYSKNSALRKMQEAEHDLKWSVLARVWKRYRGELVSAVNRARENYEIEAGVWTRNVGTLVEFKPQVILVDGIQRCNPLIMVPSIPSEHDAITVIKAIKEVTELAGVPIIYSSKYAQLESFEKNRAIFAAGAVASRRGLFFPGVEELHAYVETYANK